MNRRDAFLDVLEANDRYAREFALRGIAPEARRGLAVVTCMDSRIDPLGMLGLHPGDAKILRNAGARVTADVLRTLVLAVNLLAVRRVLVVPHTRCRMTGTTEAAIHRDIAAASGIDARSLEFRVVADPRPALLGDLQRIRSSPYLPSSIEVLGAIYDVDTGHLVPVDEGTG